MMTMRRGGRARLKASDSKSDRGPEGPSGVQILSPPPIFSMRSVRRRGDRAAEGAALEMPCMGDPCAPGSNPGPSARFFGVAVLDGELAVPCNPQSASAGLNSLSRADRVECVSRVGVEGLAQRTANSHL